ncbi:glycosyl hydrolase-related protein [Streptomyces endocoffeicus]|uniref:glycosyl hydrolase-related protein n=1 Tax=Streptomyces endocoffeicus TaxID=2898945 RepID=UPI001E37CB11|nr:glycosyl hydrolase-related protein [Streptomyces endocoffeicus]
MPALVDHPGRPQPSVGEGGARGGELDDLVDDPLSHVRLQGGRAAGTLVTGFPVLGAEVTDLLERPQHEAPTGPGELTLALHPRQILTLRLRPVSG